MLPCLARVFLLLVFAASLAYGERPWLDWPDLSPDERAEALLEAMTLDEKLTLVHGATRKTGGWGDKSYVGETAGVERLGIPALHLEDGPQGVADGVHYVTAWPSVLTVVASWDRDLMKKFAAAMALEQRIKGSNVMLGPMVNIARVPRGGRNFESFGEDPFLSSELVKAYVKGVQSQRVVACVKHWVHNNQEDDRTLVSANVSERVAWELYYPPFRAAVEVGVGSVMCAYNRVNSTYSCENSKALMTDLKGRMGFNGWVMSDWGATHSSARAALAGLDQEMPGSVFFGEVLRHAVEGGHVPESRVDDMVHRILWALFSVGVMGPLPPASSSSRDKDEDRMKPGGGDLSKTATSASHNALARTLAVAGTVLLKNDKDLLPLSHRLTKIAVIGDDGHVNPQVVDGGSGGVNPPYVITPLAAVSEEAARIGASVSYTPSNLTGIAAKEAAKADVALVFLSAFAQEGQDRTSLALSRDQEWLVRGVLSVQPRTVVVIHSPGAVLMPWAANATAILAAFVPGQADGAAITDILWGRVNPSGKLPITFPNTEEETWLKTPTQYPGVNYETSYTEELLVGYRWYNAKGLAPLFPFGHGLSYTTFSFSRLKVRPSSSFITITVDVTNTGLVAGTEVAQLYLTFPPPSSSDHQQPPRQLKGFSRVHVKPSERKGALFVLNRRDLSVWSVEKGQFVVVPGTFQVHVGSSSTDLPLQATFDFPL